MSGNSTEDGGNAAGGSSVGLALGLTFFFLLLVIIAGLITYKYYPKIRRLVNFGRRESQGKEECTVSPQAGSHHYTSVSLEQPDHTSAVQTPVYENLTAQAAAAKTSAAHPRKSSVQPEEDWYMQSDTTDDPIYNNCTAFKPSPPDPQDEDVYIVPDS